MEEEIEIDFESLEALFIGGTINFPPLELLTTVLAN